jgi:hypothetical protein
MSIGILQLAAVAVIAVIGLCLVYAIRQMRAMNADRRAQFAQAISAIEEFHKVQPELMSLLRRVESDGHALQNIAIQIEGAVTTLKDTAISSMKFAGDRQIAAIETFRDHLDSQEQELAKIVQLLSEHLSEFPQPQRPNTSQVESEPRADRGDYVRLRKEIVGRHPNVRFAVLNDWITLNWLAILRRAAGGWNTAAELIAYIPSYLEPEAEVRDGCVLIIGTRGHAERLAIPIRDTTASSELHEWFETSENGNSARHRPALLIRSNDHFEVVSKGSPHEVVPGGTHI